MPVVISTIIGFIIVLLSVHLSNNFILFAFLTFVVVFISCLIVGSIWLGWQGDNAVSMLIGIFIGALIGYLIHHTIYFAIVGEIIGYKLDIGDSDDGLTIILGIIGFIVGLITHHVMIFLLLGLIIGFCCDVDTMYFGVRVKYLYNRRKNKKS